jgi:mannose/fructose/N-acetylgalactosamine-specific phosphotransferase system component IIC
MIKEAFLGVLAGSLLWLDRVYIFQLMISRPMIMGPIIGFVMGDVKIGILIGASLELLWLNAPPVGSYLPNDETFCTAVAVPVAVLAGSSMDHMAASGLSILLSLPAALVGRSLDTHLRTLNEGLIPAGTEVKAKDISSGMRKAIARAFSLAFIMISVCVIIGGAITFFIKAVIPSGILPALKFMPFACMIIGLAALISKELPSKSHAGVFLLGMTLVLLLTWVL